MRRVVLPILLLALTAVAWPATVAHAHYPLHAWTNAQDCEVVVRLSTHVGSNHSHSFPGFEDWTLNLMLRIIPSGHEKTTSLLLGFQEPKFGDTWAAFSLRDTTHYANYSADTTWTWMLYYVWMVPNRESGKIALIGATPIQGLTDRVPTHCLTPPPPKCQFFRWLWVLDATTLGARATAATLSCTSGEDLSNPPRTASSSTNVTASG